jgi:hypothetical protein
VPRPNHAAARAKKTSHRLIAVHCISDLRLFPDLRWEKEVRWERTALKERLTRVKLGG